MKRKMQCFTKSRMLCEISSDFAISRNWSIKTHLLLSNCVLYKSPVSRIVLTKLVYHEKNIIYIAIFIKNCMTKFWIRNCRKVSMYSIFLALMIVSNLQNFTRFAHEIASFTKFEIFGNSPFFAKYETLFKFICRDIQKKETRIPIPLPNGVQ